MPFYSYRCACGHEFSARRPVSERQVARCPECEGSADLQFSTGFRFFIPLSESPSRRSGEEIYVGAYHHGETFRERFDPNVPLRAEAQADVEERIRDGKATRGKARTKFNNEVTYLHGPAQADARKTMERELDRKGVLR